MKFRMILHFFNILIPTLLFLSCAEYEHGEMNLDESQDTLNDDNGTNGGGLCNKTKLGVFLATIDTNGSVQNETLWIKELHAYRGTETGADNYGYAGYKNNEYMCSVDPDNGPIHGPKPTAYEGSIFIYEQINEGLYLSYFFNKYLCDAVGKIVNWDIYISGNNLKDNLVLADDHQSGCWQHENTVSETNRVSNPSPNTSLYQTRFSFCCETEGAVIGPLIGREFEIRIKNTETTKNVDKIGFYSSTASSEEKFVDILHSSFVIKYYDSCYE